MSTSGYVEDDELILYAMQALPAEEAAEVKRSLAANEPLRQRLADIYLTLGLYAETVAEPAEVPIGSLNRLMTAIAADNKVVEMPLARPEAPRQASRRSVISWAGWAVAAGLLVAAALQYEQSRTLEQTVAQQGSAIQQESITTASVSRERDSLRQMLQQQSQQNNASQAELAGYKDRANSLSAKVSAEAARAQHESARAADLAALASANAQETARLQGTIASQNAQVAQLSAQAANGKQVLDALSDPTALRVTLTVPKQKKTPTGRGTYVPGRGTLLFTASDLAPLPANKVYELWLLPADGSTPIPAGTFQPDAAGSATVVSTAFQRQIAAKGFAVTAEPAGGSQTPTMPILLAGL